MISGVLVNKQENEVSLLSQSDVNGRFIASKEDLHAVYYQRREFIKS